MRNTTERKQAEETLIEHTSMLEDILKKAADGICVCHNITEEPYVRFTHWNPRMEEITGYSIEEINRLGWYQSVYPDPEVQQKAIERMSEMRKGSDIQAEEWEITTKDGNKKHLSISTSIVKEEGEKVHVLAVMQDISDRKRTQKALQESERRFRELAELLPQPLFEIDLNGNFIYGNPCGLATFGYTSADIAKGLNALQLFIPEDRERVRQNIQKRLSGEDFVDHDYTGLRKDGRTLPVLIYSAPIVREGRAVGIRGIVLDLTDRKRTEDALRESEDRYRTVLETNPDPVIVYDTEGKVLYMNPAFTRVFGWSYKERFGEKMDVFVPDGAWSETKMMIDKVLAGKAFYSIESNRYTKEGKLIPVSISGAIYRDLEGDHLGTVVNLRDISKQKSLEEKLERLSYLDGLTGVANRRHFDINLDMEWRRMTRLGESLSLIMCDIDFFKAYNDTYGHQAGDKCLKEVANALKDSATRAGDLVARYGGEEFAVLLPMIDAEKAFTIAEKIQKNIYSLKIPHKKSEVSDVVTFSLGIATLFPHPRKSPNNLVELADKALYRAKHEGRNKII